MCEVATITNRLVRLSKGSFARRINILSGVVVKERIALGRLNAELDRLHALLYESYPMVSETDYKTLAPYLSILLLSLNDLLAAYKTSPLAESLTKGIYDLECNIMNIEEINSDIENFKVNIRKNPRFRGLMEALKEL